MSTHVDVLVIDGGQAGLAIGHHLTRRDRSFRILEAAATPAAAWRSRWDSLRLFTPARRSSLPGLPFPGDPDRYPTRDEVVAYLTDYARHFDLPVELSTRVTRLSRQHDAYVAEADGRTYTADQVVVATGPFQTPRTPAFASALSPHVHQLHSAAYRTPAQLPDGPVLVVGGGNTGFQIAQELSATHETHLAIGSRQTPLPQRALGRDIFDHLTRAGMMRVTVDSPLGRRLRHRETLIGSTPAALRRHGVRLHPRAADAGGTAVRFADGDLLRPTTVLWATGFGRDHGWIDVPVLDDAGTPIHRRGVTASPGLHFLGLPWQHTRGSALLGWVGGDAAHVAAQIAATPRRASTLTAT
ncbi:MAG TPA: NAD(P)/FAD-dependent oxidoreductase [Baekduia sp.]|nr:NAD(P)/FAD-dependent oxidoreductase [Baekduia sp.]